jgi:RAB protein geranylgeranyltransferase component A
MGLKRRNPDFDVDDASFKKSKIALITDTLLKIIKYSDGSREIYDLNKDFYENHRLSDNNKEYEKFHRLLDRLSEESGWARIVGSFCF